MKFNFDKICAAAEQQQLPMNTNVVSRGKLSVGIVNSQNNGKRLSISKALAEALDLKDEIAILPVPTEGVVLMSKVLPFPGTTVCKLRGDGKKVAYGAGLVRQLTECFGLDFSERVSCTFADIAINDLDGVPVAVVAMPKTATDEVIVA